MQHRLADAVGQLELDMIRAALDRADGNISQTARLLGISRPTLYDLLKAYGLQGVG